MTKTETNVFVSPAITLTTSNSFNVRFGAAWDTNYGAPADGTEPYVITSGTAITAQSNGYNMAVPTAGKYIVTLAYAELFSDSGTSKSDVFFTNATENTAKVDFTVNGETGEYRTLSGDEWTYLLSTRTVNGGTGEGKSYQRATINSDTTAVYGMILYPDDYTAQTTATSYASAEWQTMETAGCVFLPAAGNRNNLGIANLTNGCYWSSMAVIYGEDEASMLYFNSSMVELFADRRDIGCLVRLVKDVPAAK